MDKCRQSWRGNIATPLAASIVSAVLADQWDLFFYFLFILIKHAASSMRMITAFSVNLRNGVRWDIIRNRYRWTDILIQAR